MPHLLWRPRNTADEALDTQPALRAALPALDTDEEAATASVAAHEAEVTE